MDRPGPKILDKLVTLLKPFLQKEEDRKSRVYLSVGELPLLENLPWDGSSDAFITYLVFALIDYGRMESGEEALGVFLNYIKEKKGSPDFKKRIDQVLAEMTASKLPVSGTRYQDLCALTVRIRHFESDQTVGVGILIQEEHVITCGQVIRAASNGNLYKGIKVQVSLSKAAAKQERQRVAKVMQYMDYRDDEIVILKLLGDPLPGKLYARIGDANESDQHLFKAYGYVGIRNLPNDYIEGKILGYAGYHNLEVDCIILKPENRRMTNIGMKGAGVLDMENNKVVGFWLGLVEDQPRAQAVEASIVYLKPLVSSLRVGESLDD